jgi:Secretion system C-terminal sorting domain
MKNNLLCPFLIAVSTLLSINKLNAQTPQSASVEVQAVVQSNPAKITLSWNQVAGATQIQIFRKSQLATSWGTPIADFDGLALTYEDSNVNLNTLYEYRIKRTSADPYPSFGYITSGINVEPIANKGIIILVVDNTFQTSLAPQIATLRADLEGEGWIVKRLNVSPSAPVTTVKSSIKSLYNLNPLNTKALFLIGHVPVPYSGDLAPDGHPDHLGSWSADVYYADMDGVWTDNTVNRSSTGNFRNINIPGDGKFDQSYIPFNQSATNDNVELQIGRVDMFDLPLFTNSTELQLLQDYFDRDHKYRTKQTLYEARGVIDDNFGYFYGEAFAATAWRSFSPLVGSENVVEADYFTTLNTDSYLWSYGCGGGSWYGVDGDNIGGVGTTLNMATSNIKTVFTMLFGSYLGDWDHTNNIMKGSLASGALTCTWAGRPAWYFHDMAMDATIGYSNMHTHNNNDNSVYSSSYVGLGQVHATLLGDPTLRNAVISPPSNFGRTFSENGVILNWTASTEPGVLGYNIYVVNPNKTYSKINTSIITGTNFLHCNSSQSTTYILKSVKLVTSPSGTYYLESTGIKKKVVTTISPAFDVVTEDKKASIVNNSFTKNPNYNYLWEFSDGSTYNGYNPDPVTYATYGNKSVTLKLYNQCTFDSLTKSFALAPPSPEFLNSNIDNQENSAMLRVLPNPSNGIFEVEFLDGRNEATFKIYDTSGRMVDAGEINATTKKIINLSIQNSGVYFAVIDSKFHGQIRYKLIKE